MNCNTVTYNSSDISLLSDIWGELKGGLAGDSENVMIEFTGDDVEVVTSADGSSSVVYANSDTKGDITLKMVSGSPELARLREAQLNNFFARGDMTLTHLIAGEVIPMKCVGFKNRSGFSFGPNNGGVVEVVMTFASIDGYTPAQVAR